MNSREEYLVMLLEKVEILLNVDEDLAGREVDYVVFEDVEAGIKDVDKIKLKPFIEDIIKQFREN